MLRFLIEQGKSRFLARVLLFLEHVNTDPILQGSYDGGACALGGGDTTCGGSSTIPAGRWYDFGYKKAGFTPIDTAVSDFGFDYKLLGDEFVDRAGTLYNYNPTNHYQRPQDKINAGFFSKFTINPMAELYADVRFTKNKSPSQIAYSGTFGDLRAVPCYNANFSEQIYNAVCGNWTGMGASHAPDFVDGDAALAYISSLNGQVADETILAYSAPIRSLKRNVEGGPRKYSTLYENITMSLGMRGDLNDDWRYDVSYQTSQVDYVEEIQNDMSQTKLFRAVNVINVAGTPTCVSVLDGTDPNCIPYNLFSGGLPGDGGIQAIWDAGDAMQKYIAIPNFILGVPPTGDVKSNSLIAFPKRRLTSADNSSNSTEYWMFTLCPIVTPLGCNCACLVLTQQHRGRRLP